jgi:hypothetical protein
MPNPTETPLPAQAGAAGLMHPAVLYSALLATDASAATAGRPLLTPDGLAFVTSRLLEVRDTTGEQSPPEGPGPLWDPVGRRLWFHGRLVKEFSKPAPDQTALLAAFQRVGWMSHVFDPLDPRPDETRAVLQRRLRHAVRNLNSGLPRGTLRFRSDGSGYGVRWERCAPPSS